MHKNLQVLRYLIFDIIAAVVSWTLFYIYRKLYIEPIKFGYDIPVEFDSKFYLALIFIPAFWITIYYISGQYTNIYRKSRLLELGRTIMTSIAGVTVIFFLLLLNDWIPDYRKYYNLYFTLLALHFGFTYLFRLILTTRTIHRIHKRVIGFNTLVIGANEKAVRLFEDLSSQTRPAGNKIIGFLTVDEHDVYPLEKFVPNLGSYHNLQKVINDNDVEEIIIALESSEHQLLSQILTLLENRTHTVWGIPDLFDILSNTAKTNTIFGSPLLKISNGLMPVWQENVKRLIDVVVSVLSIIIFFPVFIALAIGIKMSSKGPVMYKQERIGKFGKPFMIHKLRTMVSNAETHEPQLSSSDDSRITSIGQFMRRAHLDEIPQFFNVIKGEMSLVGPRPERKFYIDQIAEVAPYVTHLQKLRPGITSWGQVKYGYASNVEQMVERLQYDMVYLKNISLYVDFKILIYTIMECVRGRGK
ncbi:bacterial sugar transferase [Aquipluma nitroreducens]|uniref:Bacterial sugar transferase n=1 Tax=Aquipluma nitroreducens TaxID=2010828 RepID=A0A5K7S741_9BACT|nr:sugar transferase [Aquipluma nitroreducens]BBE17317.1 bacterial sugar transferase [Aquipluma nitroreducens]